MRISSSLILLLALVIVASACARSSDEVEDGGSASVAVETVTEAPQESSAGTAGIAEPETSTSEPSGETETSTSEATAGTAPEPEPSGGLGDGDFGELTDLCTESDIVSSDAQGVSDSEIQIGVVTDRGAEVRPGLNEEMYDTAVAFASWCNENGGLAGRDLVIADRDAKLFEYNAAIQAACVEDFFLAGGGAVFDDADNGGRVDCGLPSIPGFVVTNDARGADLQVSATPNPPGAIGSSLIRSALDQASAPNFGSIASETPAALSVSDGAVIVVEQLGGTTVYQDSHAVTGESNWAPFVNDMKRAGVTVLQFSSEPVNLIALLKQMQQDEYYPEFIVLETNFYDKVLIDEAGDALQNVYVRSMYHPREDAAENPPTQAYLDLMASFNPDGRVAQLGQQGLSNLLLFADAVNQCSTDLSRECVLEAAALDSWTGAGMHAPTSPATNEPSDCALILEATPDGFVYDEEFTDPNEGVYNCDPLNMMNVAE